MIYILYGPDTYRSRRKLNEIISEYREKIGSAFDLHRLDADEDDLSGLKTLLGTQSLFSPKKLVIVENALASADKLETLKNVFASFKNSPDTVMVLWDRGLDENTKKRLEEIKSLASKIQEFKNLTGEALRRWTEEQASSRGIRLYPVHWAHFAALGSDLWSISNELDKIALLEDGEMASPLFTERTVFQLSDTFFTHPKDALRHLLALIHHGHDEFQLFSYLANHNRKLLLIKHHLDQGRAIPKNLGIHPYVLQKTSPILRQVPSGRLEEFLRRFFTEDFKIKTGLARPAESLFHLLIS